VTRSPSRQQQRILAVLLLLAVLFCIWAGAVNPLLDAWSTWRQSRQQQRDEIARMLQAAARKPELEARLQRIRQREPGMKGAVTGATAALAAAALQNDVRQIVGANGGEIRSTQNLPSLQVGEWERIAIRYDLVVPMERLPQLLRQLESHVPYLLLDEVSVRAPEGTSPEPQPGGDVKLAVRWDVRAYRSTGAP
jgi:hypothetical protein